MQPRPDDAPPNNLQLERALLALVLTDNGVLDRVTRLEPEHFFDAVNREVFTVARELRRDGKSVNLVMLGGLMGGDPLGGAASILDSIKSYSMAGELPDAISVEDSLVNLYTRRRMLAAGEAPFRFGVELRRQASGCDRDDGARSRGHPRHIAASPAHSLGRGCRHRRNASRDGCRQQRQLHHDRHQGPQRHDGWAGAAASLHISVVAQAWANRRSPCAWGRMRPRRGMGS